MRAGAASRPSNFVKRRKTWRALISRSGSGKPFPRWKNSITQKRSTGSDYVLRKLQIGSPPTPGGLKFAQTLRWSRKAASKNGWDAQPVTDRRIERLTKRRGAESI